MRSQSDLRVPRQLWLAFTFAGILAVLPSTNGLAQSEGAAARHGSWYGSRSVALFTNCSAEVADEAERVLSELRDFGQRGVVSGFEIFEAELFALEVSHCAGRITKAELCAEKGRRLEDFGRRIQDLLKAGNARFLQARRNWVQWSAELSTVCGG